MPLVLLVFSLSFMLYPHVKLFSLLVTTYCPALGGKLIQGQGSCVISMLSPMPNSVSGTQ